MIWGPIVDGMPGRSVCSDNAAGASAGHATPAATWVASASRSSAARPTIGPNSSCATAAGKARNAKPGIEPDARLLVEAQSSEDAGHEATVTLLGRGAEFDAVFAASDLDRHRRDRRIA